MDQFPRAQPRAFSHLRTSILSGQWVIPCHRTSDTLTVFNVNDAAEVGDLIQRGQPDARLKWMGPDAVWLVIGEIIPDDGYNATISGRRKRFRAALNELLSARGWRPTVLNRNVRSVA